MGKEGSEAYILRISLLPTRFWTLQSHLSRLLKFTFALVTLLLRRFNDFPLSIGEAGECDNSGHETQKPDERGFILILLLTYFVASNKSAGLAVPFSFLICKAGKRLPTFRVVVPMK